MAPQRAQAKISEIPRDFRPGIDAVHDGRVVDCVRGPHHVRREAARMSTTPQLGDLTPWVARARRGFRSDVEPLTRSLATGSLLVPLARAIDGVPLGEAVELTEVSLVPHMIADGEGGFHVPLFTRLDILELVAEHLGWTTQGDELQSCTLPGPVAADLALDLFGHADVAGVVINPGDEAELLLRREELASIAQGKALPLVGYVSQIPLGANEQSLVCEMDSPLPPEVVREVESCVASFEGLSGYRIEQTFNAERDVEPHLTVTLQVGRASLDMDTARVGQHLWRQLEGKLPPPGYMDVLFEVGDSEK